MMAVGTTCSNASRPPHWERRDRRRPAIIDRRYSGNDERRFRNPNLRHFQAPRHWTWGDGENTGLRARLANKGRAGLIAMMPPRLSF
jgi:hypothetical protein